MYTMALTYKGKDEMLVRRHRSRETAMNCISLLTGEGAFWQATWLQTRDEQGKVINEHIPYGLIRIGDGIGFPDEKI